MDTNPPQVSTGNRQNSVGRFSPAGVNRTSQIITTIIPAGQKFPVSQAGRRFYLPVATGAVNIKPNNGSTNNYVQGTGLEVDENNIFANLEVHNPNTFNVVIQIFVGFGSYIDNRLIVYDPNTISTLYGTSPIVNVSANIDIPDLSGNPITGPNGELYLALNRIAIYVSNVDLASDYTLKNVALNQSYLTTFHLTNSVIPAQGHYHLSGGGLINATVAELYNVIRA